ncbi:hypothetical protein Tco_1263396, partial [Tanacetum coccineum]
YKLKLGVADDTAHAVVVIFDETTKSPTESLVGTEDEYTNEHSSLPVALANIIGTTHVLELKSHTYYKFGSFESFTCWKINPTESAEESATSSTSDALASKSPLSLKRSDLEDSDAEEACGSSKEVGDYKADHPSDKKRKKRIILDDSGSEYTARIQ